jgi:DNA helicase-2/ATP-dependent DNA helicase PcrA
MFDTGPAWLAELNEAQRRAVVARGAPLLVVAGAGTGKTRTLACRVAHLVSEGVAPERILLLTFSRRAAQEMLRRAELVTGQGECGRVWGGTFHAVGCRLLRTYGREVGVPAGFTVMDQSDGAELMSLIRCDLGLDRSRRRFPRKDTLAAIYSRTVNARARLSFVLDQWFPWCRADVDGIREVFTRYVERKTAQGLLDYDDLLLYWHALAADSNGGARLAGLFDHVLVDEYQDTNPLQAEILRLMCRGDAELMVVGDDAQAIYSFRSATVENMLDFPSHHPGAAVVLLEQNYRSARGILQASNAVIAQARRRFSKELWSEVAGELRPALVTCAEELQQSEAVCRRVLEARERGIALASQAVLFRAGHHSSALEIELSRRNIPFVKYGGLKFLESAHVKDALAFLRILENPADELSWFRVLQHLEGLGPATARRTMAALGVGGCRETPLHRLVSDPPRVPERAQRDFESLREALRDCTLRPEASPGVQLERARRFFEPIFTRLYENPATRLRDLEQLERIAAGFPSRSRFITELTLDPPHSTADLAGRPLLDDDYLVLSTIHSAKGCEWEVVYVLHASDGMIPSDMALGDEDGLEEELRLLYVAMTRARQELVVLFALRHYLRPAGLGDAHGYAQLTRFIPSSVRALFDDLPGDPAERAPRGGAAQGVRRALEDLWS